MDFDEEFKKFLEKKLNSMKEKIEEIYEIWNEIPYSVREKLDAQFNETGTPSYNIRWLESAIDDLSYDFENVYKDLTESENEEEEEYEQ